MIDTNTSLGDLAATGTDARGVLLRYQLDFCCGGGRSLATACEAAGLDLDQVVAELEVAANRGSDSADWRERSVEELVEHILERYHRPLPDHIDSVLAAAEKVERVHGAKESCPRGLAAHLRSIRDGLMSHLAKEEQVLFPALLAGRRGGMLSGPVTVMMREHDDHGDNLKRTRALTNDFTPPAEACATWRAMYEELDRLEADLMAHIHLENHVLFPRALQEG
ncbi:MAG: iron-sulfur cluster repair di-iron protein [Deltaproteobacteria bacterium]|nr:iron-sulfur cluster repair di-iron protein [Myxococcales bacterium]MCB9490183.1 iron-sulfur cluster repair di-iron protein [Deltaproteobacteria bacterium]